jgi:predicted RNase H-like HicB family nuclease
MATPCNTSRWNTRQTSTTWPTFDALRRPLTGLARRPDHICFRGNPPWEELFRHLNELGIPTSVHEKLPKVEEVFEDFFRQMRQANPGPFIVVSPGRGQVAEQFPAVAKWVQGYGHIELGDQEGIGFVVRAMDSGGLVFEDNQADTLAEALATLDEALARWFEGQGIEV